MGSSSSPSSSSPWSSSRPSSNNNATSSSYTSSTSSTALSPNKRLVHLLLAISVVLSLLGNLSLFLNSSSDKNNNNNNNDIYDVLGAERSLSLFSPSPYGAAGVLFDSSSGTSSSSSTTTRKSTATTTTTTTTTSIPKHCLSLDFDFEDGDGHSGDRSTSSSSRRSMDALLSSSSSSFYRGEGEVGGEVGGEGMKKKKKQVYIVMPAKAAGTSLKRFTHQCTNVTTRDNFFNWERPRKNMLFKSSSHQQQSSSSSSPKILTSHLLKDATLIYLAKHATSDSLIIFIYRDETDRLLSGIREVASHRLCRGRDIPPGLVNITLPVTGGGGGGVQRNNNNNNNNATTIKKGEEQCILDERLFVEYIEQRRAEVGFGIPEILTCDSYAALEDNYLYSNVVVVNYRQVDRLQRLLAKNYCPNLLDQPLIRANLGEDQISVSIQLQSAKLRRQRSQQQQQQQQAARIVKLDDWLAAKGDLIEFALGLKTNMTCQGKTRKLAHALSQCPDEIMKGWGGGSGGLPDY